MKEGVEISRKIPGHHKTFKRHQPAMSFVPHHNERRFYGQEDSRDCATPTRVWSHLTDLCFGNIWAVNHVYTCVCNGEKYSCTVLKQMSLRWHAFPTAHLIIKQNHLSASFNRSAFVLECDQAGRTLLSRINHSLPRHKRAEALGLFLMEMFPGWWFLPTLSEDFKCVKYCLDYFPWKKKNLWNMTNSMKYSRVSG